VDTSLCDANVVQVAWQAVPAYLDCSLVALHSVSLATACLAVGKNGPVVALPSKIFKEEKMAYVDDSVN
jgi:hypothetical protein